MERRLIGIATGEIKRLLVGKERVTSRGPARRRKQQPEPRWRKYSFHYPLSETKRDAKLYAILRREASRLLFFLNAVHTHTHTRGVPQTAIATCTKAGQSPDQRRWTRFRVVAPFFSSFQRCRFHILSVPKKQRQIAKSHRLAQKPHVAQSQCEASRLFVHVEAQQGRRNGVSVERLASGAVIADARCNLSILSLFTSLFSFFLNYLKCYLSNNEIWKEKKNWTCRFFALWLMSSFLRKNVLCVLSSCGVKKELVVCRDNLIFFSFLGGLLLLFAVVDLFLFNSQKGFQVVFKVIVTREAKVNAFQWIL